ncbi:18178_t:CDS:2, partial [Gigaspora margarita]
TSESVIADYIEKGKKTSPAPSITVALLSKSTNIYITPEIEYVESLNDKLEAPEIVEESEIQGYILSVENEPEISTNSSVKNDKPESSNELSSYAEELASKLSDAPGRHVEGRDPIKIIAQYIIKNDLSPEEINGIAYDLASLLLLLLGADYPITEAMKIPFITEEANQIQARKRTLLLLSGNVQERLNECDITKPPSMQNLIDVMIMLCMQSADMENLRINRYEPSHMSWYNPDYSWYCIGYAKNKGERSISDRFPFLLKDKDGNTNVAPLNLFLSRHRITSFILRKIGADHASRVHGGKNDSCRQYLRQLACRHKIGHASSVEHYGIMNDRPNTLASK